MDSPNGLKLAASAVSSFASCLGVCLDISRIRRKPVASQNKPYIRYYHGLGETLSHSQLYLSPRPAFTGISSSLEKSRFVFFGVPFDRTSTYKPGSRFAPSALRNVSANMELYSIRSNLDLEKIAVHDAGDIDTVEDLN